MVMELEIGSSVPWSISSAANLLHHAYQAAHLLLAHVGGFGLLPLPLLPSFFSIPLRDFHAGPEICLPVLLAVSTQSLHLQCPLC